MVARTTQQKRDRFVTPHAVTERTILSYRVKAIDNRDDARRDWYLFAFEPVRITEPVPLLVMVAHNGRYWIRKVNPAEYLRADGGVNLHFFKLGGSQSAGLVDDMRRHCKFPNVVKQGSCSQGRQF